MTITNNTVILIKQTNKCNPTLSPVLWIFSVSWSTAMLDGAHTSTGPLFCFTMWYTTVADVTVLPVPGGP